MTYSRIPCAAVLLLGLGLVIAGAGRSAERTPPHHAFDPSLRIAVVNIRDCLNRTKYARVRDLESEYKNFVVEQGKPVIAANRKVEGKREEIKVALGVPELLKRLQKELETLISDQQRVREQSDDRVQEEYGRMSLELHETVHKAIREYAAKNKYDLILEVGTPDFRVPSFRGMHGELKLADHAKEQIKRWRGVLYNDPAMDITNEVIKKLNTSYRQKK